MRQLEIKTKLFEIFNLPILLAIDFIGITVMHWLNVIGSFTLFIAKIVKALFKSRLKIAKCFGQMEQVGLNSLGITLITGTFAGAVLALQSYKGFHELGSENYLGPIVALTLARELGPVLTGLMVAGRAGSAIAAELGTMRITEQIDALETLQINTFQYLIVPRVLAGVLILPLLALFSIIFGILGGYVVCVYKLDLNSEVFIVGIKQTLLITDIYGGMLKASIFGFILTTIGAYQGYFTDGGAKGVGIATTQAVVLSSILIIITNYFLAELLFGP